MQLPAILVTDPEQRAALAAVRALGDAGYRVDVVGRGRGLAGFSRFVSASHRLKPDVLSNPKELPKAIAELVQARKIGVVLPVTDGASMALLGEDSQIGAVVAGPTRDAYVRASDKRRLMELAPSFGLRVPRQFTMLSPSDDPEPAYAFGAVVVKPSRSVVTIDGRAVGTKVQFAGAAATLKKALKGFPAEAYPLLVQERVVGDGVGVFLLRRDGCSLLQFGHLRLREKPPAGGVSTYRAVHLPPASLVTSCERLLDALGYEGAAMVEFKRDQLTGDYVLMEVNARLWGSVQLAVDAGMDFPTALVRMACGEPVDPPSSLRTEVRSVWELGELDHMLALLRRTSEDLHLPDHASVGIRAVLQVLLDRTRHDRTEVFRWSDPIPFAAELFRWAKRAA